MAEVFGCLKGPESRQYECTKEIAQAAERSSVITVRLTDFIRFPCGENSKVDRKNEVDCSWGSTFPYIFNRLCGFIG
jgi:hypothetical protein